MISTMVCNSVTAFKQASNQTCWCSHFLLTLLFVKLTLKKLQANSIFSGSGYCPCTLEQRIYHLNGPSVGKRGITLPL